MPTREMTFRFPATPQYLTALRHAVHAFCVDLLESEAYEEQVYQLQLAASELATNIMTHAYGDCLSGVIELHAVGSDGAVTLEFFDSGTEYQMKTPTLPELERLAEGGYGSFIIQQSVDRVIYERADERNHWRLEKQFIGE